MAMFEDTRYKLTVLIYGYYLMTSQCDVAVSISKYTNCQILIWQLVILRTNCHYKMCAYLCAHLCALPVMWVLVCIPTGVRKRGIWTMFMDDTPVFMIMLMGRWSSDAFLKYIRRQVLEFSKGMSRRMVKNEYLYAIPTHQSDSNDPRTQNQNSFATNLSLAPSSHRNNIQPAFSLWH